MAEYCHIPGNIKQEFIPFLLNPDAKINQHVENSINLAGAAPQYFTFKTNQSSIDDGGIGVLGLFPNSFSEINLKKDLSYRMLYGRNADGTINPGSKEVTLTDILNAFPSIQIREYMPDSRLDQVLNFFTEMFKKSDEVTKKENTTSGDAKSTSGNSTTAESQNNSGFFDKLIGVMNFIWKYMVGTIDTNFLKDIGSKIKQEAPLPGYTDVKNSGHGLYVLRIPALFYCGLQDCTTTNLYELPAMLKDKKMLESNGTAGWSNNRFNMTKFFDIFGKTGIARDIANTVLKNIGMHYMPYWNSESATEAPGETVQIEIDLVNDSPDRTLANFIFVNTLIPNNRWIQYNFFQHSPALYDIKIEGINRLFVCSGQFDISYSGVLRDPPNSFISALTAKHINKNMSGDFKSNLQSQKLIKIPDVYHVTMTFNSLLPANFNTMMMSYAQNSNMMTDKSKIGYSKGFTTEFANILNDFGGHVADVWKNGGDYKAAGFKDVPSEN